MQAYAGVPEWSNGQDLRVGLSLERFKLRLRNLVCLVPSEVRILPPAFSFTAARKPAALRGASQQA